MSELAARPSRAPEAPTRKHSTRQATRAAARRRSAPLSTGCAAVLARCTRPLADDARAFFSTALSDAVAAREGARFACRRIVSEWLRVSAMLVRPVLDEKVTGYGPARFRYAAELAVSLAAMLEPGAAPTVHTTVSSAPSVDVDTLKRTVAQALRNLGIEARAGLHPNASGDKVSHSFDELAAAVRRAQATVPASVLTDAGITASVLDALDDASDAAITSHTSSLEARAVRRSTSRREQALGGRLLHELKLLRAAARAAHPGDASVPVVKAVARSRRAKPAAKPAPVDPAAPR